MQSKVLLENLSLIRNFFYSVELAYPGHFSLNLCGRFLLQPECYDL